MDLFAKDNFIFVTDQSQLQSIDITVPTKPVKKYLPLMEYLIKDTYGNYVYIADSIGRYFIIIDIRDPNNVKITKNFDNLGLPKYDRPSAVFVSDHNCFLAFENYGLYIFTDKD